MDNASRISLSATGSFSRKSFINGWTGKLRSLRLDYSDGSEGDCYVDYIALQTTDEKKAGAAETEEVSDPRAGKSVLYKWDFTTLTAEDIRECE